MKTTLEILKAARERVAKGWTQGEVARDAAGLAVGSISQDAVCWCSLGALNGALGPGESWDGWSDAKKLLRIAAGIYDNISIVDWNDAPGRTQAEVIAAFTRAIEMCGRENG